MIIVFQLVCMCLSLYVLQKYITTGVYSAAHRLLPLVLGMITAYNFYEVAVCITDEVEFFLQVKDLLQIQMLYLLLFYAMDFLRIKLPGLVEQGLFILLLCMDLFVLLQNEQVEIYKRGFSLFVFWYMILILGMGIYAYIKYSFRKREHRVTKMLYFSLLIPAFSLYFEKFQFVRGEIIMPLSLACTCGIIYYLLETEQLIDPLLILQENQYDTSDIAVVFFDADYYYLGANQAARRLFPEQLGLSPNRSNTNLYLDKIRVMAKNQDKQKEIEVEGSYYRCQLTPVYYHNKLRGYSLSIWNVTEQKKETRLMANLKNVAENRTVLKSRFLATMSHDLRSPLHEIIGISDMLLAKREMSARNRSLILHIKSAGNTLLEQVDAILDYSRLEAGKLELVNKSYQMEHIVEELAHMCAVNLQSKPVHFSISVLTEYPKQLLGDEMRVREIIQNLLSNAVKFTEKGEVRCEIRCINQLEAKRTYISCSVTDTGPGMSGKQLEQIFQEYVSSADGRELEGTGLGLCIVKQLAERMGGSVSAVSDGRSGSTVTASFYQEMDGTKLSPAFSVTSESILRQSAAFTGNIRPDYVYPKARVLLADDIEVSREIFRELALPWKFEIDFVKNGKEAVEAVQKQAYQMIFLDQVMPEMTGDEAAEEIRKYCDTPLVLMTADPSKNLDSECLQRGYADFLPKPIDLALLQKVVEQHMPKSYRQDSAQEEGERVSASEVQAYRRTLKTFVREIEPLAGELEEYVEQDLELFRIKAHGIKGASRQIGRVSVGENAEIMEMAAKTGNLAFIQSHLADFLRELSEVVEDVRMELAQIPVVEGTMKQEINGTKELWERLKEGFDTYNIKQIEESIKLLDEVVLPAEEKQLLEQAKAACEDLDYEKGSGLFAL